MLKHYSDSCIVFRIKKHAFVILPDYGYRSLNREGDICSYCGKKMARMKLVDHQQQPHNTCTRDHVIPKSQGGESVIYNIVPCCSKCNNKKASLSLFEFFWRNYALLQSWIKVRKIRRIKDPKYRGHPSCSSRNQGETCAA